MLAGFGCGSVSKSPSQNTTNYPLAALAGEKSRFWLIPANYRQLKGD
jgi:hypothetical protein